MNIQIQSNDLMNLIANLTLIMDGKGDPDIFPSDLYHGLIRDEKNEKVLHLLPHLLVSEAGRAELRRIISDPTTTIQLI